jgi:integral membrane sensor domain MASE1
MPKRWLSHLALGASLTLIYVAAGKLGLTLAFVNASATAVWPPTGIALAAFVVLGYRIWPAILLGAFLVNVTTSGVAATSIAIAVGNTLEGIVGGYLVNRFAHGRQVFERARDLFTYILLACIVSTTVSGVWLPARMRTSVNRCD